MTDDEVGSRNAAPPPHKQSMRSLAPAPSRTTFGAVFGVTEFRALWTAQVLSVAGDQLARVALTLLVFARTHSALLAAVTFTASVVPAFVGGLALSGLGDRWPRRRVMITCDLISALLVAVMALPGVPTAARVGLLIMVTMIGAAFSSARAALLADVLTGDRYVLGTGITLTTIQFAQVLGFAVGGAAVAFFGVSNSLLADAATFIMSAVIVRLWVQARPRARPKPHPSSLKNGSRECPAGGPSAGLRLVFTSPALLIPMLFGWLASFYNIPEGVVAPLARTLGGGDVAVGLLLAAGAFGASVGALLLGRLAGPEQRLRWMGPLAIASCAVLMLFFLHPPLPMALLVLAVSGLCTCYQLPANAAFVRAVPAEQRSQSFGIALGGMSLGQGAAMILAGAAAGWVSPSLVIGAGGAVGVVTAVVVVLMRSRARQPDHASRDRHDHAV